MSLDGAEVDLVCVGAGLGGLAAATAAAEHGAEVLLLERSTYIGGVAAYSGGWVWVGANHLMERAGIPDDLGTVEQYLDGVQRSDELDRERRRAYLALAVEATRWFELHGVPFTIVDEAPDLFHPSPGSTTVGRALECAVPAADLAGWREHLRPSPYYRIGVTRTEIAHGVPPGQDTGMLTHGVGLVGAFAREALVRRGADCRLSTHVESLLVEDGRVVGVRASTPDGPVRVRARRGVVLATGGYGGAAAAAGREGMPEFIEASPPVVDGAAEALTRPLGAGWTRGADPFVVLGARLDDATHPGSDLPLYYPVLESTGFPGSIIVNQAGERFGDESYYGSLIAGLAQRDGGSWRNHPCWLVVDDRFRQRYRLGPLPAGAPYPAEHVAIADDVRKVAGSAGIDPDGLEATVRRFNEQARRGEDEHFGRGQLAFTRRIYGDPDVAPNPNLGPLETPPYHAIPLRVLGVGLCTYGLDVDLRGRVRRTDGSVVPGLYATGNAAATRILDGYVTGLANARNHVLAWAAAMDAVGRDGQPA